MFGFLKKIGGAISHVASSVGKKASNVVGSAVSLGKKVAGSVGTIAKKVSSVSDAVSKGLAVAGGVAGAIGLEPVAGVLEAGALGAKGVSEASAGVSSVAGKVGNVADTIGRVSSAVGRGNVAGAMAGAGTLKRQVQDVKTSAQTTTRSAIERGKDVRQQFKKGASKPLLTSPLVGQNAKMLPKNSGGAKMGYSGGAPPLFK
jgi:hypothetical protein